MGLVASQHAGSSQARDWTRVPCTGRQICNHWTTREVQFSDIFDDRYSDLCDVIPHLILIGISLIISDIEHLFICLLAICLYPLEKCLVKSSAYFLVLGFFFFLYGVVWAVGMFWILTSLQSHHLKIFSPILWVIISSYGYGFLCYAKTFELN